MSCELSVAAASGLIGAILGGIVSLLLVWLQHWLGNRKQVQLDKRRKKYFLTMLNDPQYKWRSLDMLARVAGVDHENAKRLLIDVKARGSQLDKDSWGLISRNPIPTSDAGA